MSDSLKALVPKNYTNLGSLEFPSCYDHGACINRHKGHKPTEVNRSKNAILFNVLDHKLTCWTMYDVAVVCFSELSSEQHFSDSIFRVLFTYLLNGPCNNQMHDIEHVVRCHFQCHPPCSANMREFYQKLVYLPSSDPHVPEFENIHSFKTLKNDGVFIYILKTLEVITAGEKIQELSDSSSDESEQPLTFELMERSFNKGQLNQLMEKKRNKAMQLCQSPYKKDFEDSELPKEVEYQRLILALKLIVDLLEMDFLICVSKLKRYIADESKSLELEVPMIEQCCNTLKDSDMCNVFKLYATTTDKALWLQLTRLIGMMAEQVHLFKLPVQKFWQYPNLHLGCNEFVTDLCNTIDRATWDNRTQLERLQALRPSWLQFQVAMKWASSDLKLPTKDADLKTLVEMIYVHVKRPMQLENLSIKGIQTETIEDVKKITRKNQFGKVLLHSLCSQKSSVGELLSVLAMPQTDINAKDFNGATPLHEAVWCNSILKARLLLQHEPIPGKDAIDVCAQNNEGYTPLNYAVYNNNLDLCKLLVDFGGMKVLTKTDYNGKTPVDYAKDKAEQVPEIFQYFQEVIWKQELLISNPDSELNMSDHVIQLLMIACDAFMSDYHTLKLNSSMQIDDTEVISPTKRLTLIGRATLFKFGQDQKQITKLCQILNNLSKNPMSSTILKLWSLKFQSFKSNALDVQE